MQKYLGLAQTIVAALLIALVLLQQRGAGLGGVFGGLGEFYSTRRGIEKTIFGFTIIVATLFVALAILSLLF